MDIQVATTMELADENAQSLKAQRWERERSFVLMFMPTEGSAAAIIENGCERVSTEENGSSLWRF